MSPRVTTLPGPGANTFHPCHFSAVRVGHKASRRHDARQHCIFDRACRRPIGLRRILSGERLHMRHFAALFCVRLRGFCLGAHPRTRPARPAMTSTSSCATKRCSASSSSPASSPPRSAAPTSACCAPPCSTSVPPTIFPAPTRHILTEAECDALKHNNDAVYASIGFKQVDQSGQPAQDDLSGRPVAARGQAVDRELAGVRESAGQPRRHRRVPRLGPRILHQLVLARLHVLQRADAHLRAQLRLGTRSPRAPATAGARATTSTT